MEKLAISRLSWIAAWGVGSALPLVPYLMPLLHDTLSDGPVAYLLWIPAFAYCWACWSLYEAEAAHLTASASSFMWAAALMAAAGLLLLAGELEPAPGFIRHDWAILIWPLWSIGGLWMLFGFAAIRSVWRPLLYGLLGWPPLYLALVRLTTPLLRNLTLSVLSALTRHRDWIGQGPTPEIFRILARGRWITVDVSSACSGADSLLAMLAFLPIMLVLLRLRFLHKALFVAAGCVLAILFNLLRLGLLFLAAHGLGAPFAFNILHPLLGPAFFLLIAALLLGYGTKKTALRSAHSPRGPNRAIHPGTLRGITFWGLVLLLVAGLLPLYG